MNYTYTLSDYLNDRKTIIKQSKKSNIIGLKDLENIINRIKEIKEENKENNNIVVDFTEYNPLHKGHKYALNFGKEYGIFVSILPGPLERSGRGIPYFLNREFRKDLALLAGVDLVIEGPPMGIMGSGQYMLCLIKLFHKIGGNIIVRGYIPEKPMESIIKYINDGYHIGVKPYNIHIIEKKEKICEKLEIDNYVIGAMSQTIYKLNRKYGLNYKPKFIFVKRIEGISGTKIREEISKGNLQSVKSQLPKTTFSLLWECHLNNVLQDYILKRFEDRILETVNEYRDCLVNYIPENVARALKSKKGYNNLDEIRNNIPKTFSKNQYNRILSMLECRLDKTIISEYVENYPNIKILGINDKYRKIL